MGSTGNLTCLPNQANVPDVNIGSKHIFLPSRLALLIIFWQCGKRTHLYHYHCRNSSDVKVHIYGSCMWVLSLSFLLDRHCNTSNSYLSVELSDDWTFNIGIYIGLILQKATDVIEIEEVENGSNRIRKVSLLAAFRRSNFTPTLTLCLRDAGILLQSRIRSPGILL
jgi:hypothetical protein